jgi:hypothetical protein
VGDMDFTLQQPIRGNPRLTSAHATTEFEGTLDLSAE